MPLKPPLMLIDNLIRAVLVCKLVYSCGMANNQ